MKKNLNHQFLVKLLIISAVIAIIAVATVPKTHAQSMSENEKSAIAILRAISIAQGKYRAQTGIVAGDSKTLIDAGLLDSDLACVNSNGCIKNGYRFVLVLFDNRPTEYFNIGATPQTFGVTGAKSFYIGERGVIYYNATAASPTANASTRAISNGFSMLNIFPNKFDFNANGKSDVAVFRPSIGTWFLRNDLLIYDYRYQHSQLGLPTDRLVPADYNGDGRTDYAVYRDGVWYSDHGFVVLNGRNSGYVASFGEPDDIPVPANFDVDGITDVAVYRPSNGTWYVRQSTGGITATEFGQANDKPVAADFDGDGLADMAVFEPSTGIWQIRQSKDGLISFQFGTEEDKLVVADYDGDGRADIAVYRRSNGFWYLQQSQAGFSATQFGDSTDLPVPTDYDGDGSVDIAVYRGGTWFIQQSTAGFKAVQYGTSDDRPVANAFVR